MIISGLRAQRFGCLDDLSVEFVPGLNLIKGPNETGKSTLHRAILMALFERTSKKRSNEAWRAWGADRLFELALYFSIEGRGEWRLEKDFEENAVLLSNGRGEAHRTYDALQEKIGEFLGTSDLGIYTSTACVEQDAIADMGSGRKGIAQQLETIITGGHEDANTLEVIQKVTSTVRDYKRGYQTTAYANPGPIARLVTQRSELLAAVGELQVQDEQFVRNMERKQVLADRLIEIESELTPRLQIQRMANEYQEIEDEYKEWQRAEIELEGLIEKINDAEAGLTGAESTLAELGDVAKLSEGEVQEIEQAQMRYEFLREHPPAGPAPAVAAVSDGQRPSIWLPMTVFVLSLLSALASLSAVDAAPEFETILLVGLVSSLLVAAGSGIWTIVAISRRSRWKELGPTSSSYSVPAELPELAALQAELSHKLEVLGCRDWDEFVQKRASVEAAERARERAISQLEVLVPASKSKSDLEAERQQASRKRRDAEEKMGTPEMKRLAALNPVALGKLEQEINGFQAEKEKLSGELTQLNYAIAAATDRSEELLAAEERLASVEAEIDRQVELLATYELALGILETAREKTLVRAHHRLAPILATYLKGLTGGRYSRVEVNSDLSIEVWPPQAEFGSISPDQLSRGARDQLYFAARLALVDLLFGDAKPPIFLDDPFVTFDPKRRKTAIELCRTVALDRQVFLFTCTSEYDAYGHVIELNRLMA